MAKTTRRRERFTPLNRDGLHRCTVCGSIDLRDRERHCLPCKIEATARMKARRKRHPLRHRVKRAVLARDGMVCRHCGDPVRRRVNMFDFGPDVLEFDHLVALSRGGKSIASNVVVACLSCNRGRNNRPLPIAAEVA